MNKEIAIGDLVMCSSTGIVGKVINIYKPTACETQIMVLTNNYRYYHAPYSEWCEIESGYFTDDNTIKIFNIPNYTDYMKDMEMIR